MRITPEQEADIRRWVASGTGIEGYRKEEILLLGEIDELREELVLAKVRMRTAGALCAQADQVIRNLQEQSREVCICAAIRLADGTVIRGHRHHACIYYATQMQGTPGTPGKSLERRVDGFITSRGRFVTREEGRALQDEAGIESVSENGYMARGLCSEDLY